MATITISNAEKVPIIEKIGRGEKACNLKKMITVAEQELCENMKGEYLKWKIQASTQLYNNIFTVLYTDRDTDECVEEWMGRLILRQENLSKKR